jgi:hypothetical protein
MKSLTAAALAAAELALTRADAVAAPPTGTAIPSP